MIQYIKLKNYKSYNDITFDFRGKNNVPKKLIIVYGANGSGKSSLIQVFNTLDDLFSTMQIKNIIADYLERNSDKLDNEAMNKIRSSLDIKRIIKDCRALNTTEDTVIEIGFELDNKSGIYNIEFDDENIIHEHLEFTVSKNRGLYFDIQETSSIPKYKINPRLFLNTDFAEDLSVNIEKYWGKHTFLSILLYEREELANSYFDNNVNKNLLKVLNYFSTISYHIDEGYRAHGSIYDVIPIVNLQHGTINKDELPKLDESKDHLRKFLKGMYKDIEDIKYNLIPTTNTDKVYEYNLLLVKKIADKIVEIPADCESTGTSRLIHLFPIFVAATKPGIVAIDEVDNGIHDILMTNLIENLEPYIKEQLIITTHNLMLLNINKFQDYFYFIDIDQNGTHTVNTIKDSNIRIQSDYNLMFKYIKGCFKGIPWENMNIDFSKFNNDHT